MHAADNGLCAVCRREARHHGWFDPAYPALHPQRDASRRKLCSRLCQDICHGRRGMIDPTPNEKAALANAAQMGGEYLDSLGRTDLATLSTDQWECFIEAVVTGFCDHLRELAARDRTRLDAMTAEVPF